MSVVFLLLGLIIGIASTFLVLRSKMNSTESINVEKESILEKESTNLKAELKDERSKVLNLSSKLSSTETQISNLEEKLKTQRSEFEDLNQKFSKEFQVLANNILEEKSKKFTDQNKQNLNDILVPLKEKIVQFEKKVEDNSKESTARHASLKEQLSQLRDLNQKITKEAENLTKALKGDTKAQGNWGEFILESILEKSGLEKGREYFTQESYTQEGRRYRPDVIVKLPDSKSVIIDSKVSLIAYERYVGLEEGVSKEQELKSHLLSIRKHLKDLSEKEYQSLEEVGSLDFILMFIPIEPAFSLAVQNDSSLFNDAYSKNIVIVSPSTLIATLRTIANIWKQEYQNRNALEIARQSGALYDKFVGFTEDLKKIGSHLDIAQRTYQDAGKKLYTGSGNIVKRIQNIKKLGASTEKTIDQKLLDRAEE
ncbi:MAG: DNA recombination protein RmuC [Bacteroidota bacterium]